MLHLVLMLLVTQVPCVPADSTVVCHCKQGQASACVALRVADPKKADEIERLVVQAAKVAETAAGVEAATQSEAEASSSESEPPDCKGQNHHVISRLIAKELEAHKTLKGLYKPRDPRFVARAKDEQSHCGYQDWHRKVDKEVIDWLRRNDKARPEEFMELLREVYSRAEMRARFPNGF